MNFQAIVGIDTSSTTVKSVVNAAFSPSATFQHRDNSAVPVASATASEDSTPSCEAPPPLRSRRPGQWCWLDMAVIATYGPRIGAYGVAVYAVLAEHANRRTQACWPSIGLIASQLRLSRSTVKKTLRMLEAEGLIRIQARRDPQGDPTSHCYTLLDPMPEMVAPALEVLEGGRSPENPPSVATQPTGRSSHNQEPPEAQPAERTSKPSDDRSAYGERKPKAETKDETSSWNKPAVPFSANTAERPDEQLSEVEAEEHVRLYLRAKQALIAEGMKEQFLILPRIQVKMLELREVERGGQSSGRGDAPCASRVA